MSSDDNINGKTLNALFAVAQAITPGPAESIDLVMATLAAMAKAYSMPRDVFQKHMMEWYDETKSGLSRIDGKTGKAVDMSAPKGQDKLN